MIKLKDLNNRDYDGRKCISFEYVLKDEKENKLLVARFSNEDTSGKVWRMNVIFDRNRDADSQVYNFGYSMPKDNLPLELIAATGLKYFQLYLQQEIQQKSGIEFSLGSLLEGM